MNLVNFLNLHKKLFFLGGGGGIRIINIFKFFIASTEKKFLLLIGKKC